MDQLQQSYPQAPASVPTITQWKKLSDQNIKFSSMASRKEQVAALDKLIQDYPNARLNEMKFVMLFAMQGEIYSHLTNKPKSDRRAAVEQLGASVTAVLKSLPANLDLDDLNDGQYGWVMNTLGWRSRKLAHA